MITKSLLSATLLVLLGSCAATQKHKVAFDREMGGWIGRTADELVLAKGPPSGSATLSTGEKVFEYSKSRMITGGGGSYTVTQSVYTPTQGGGGTWANVPMQKTHPVYSAERSCKVLFKISTANIVESWSSEGNNCY